MHGEPWQGLSVVGMVQMGPGIPAAGAPLETGSCPQVCLGGGGGWVAPRFSVSSPVKNQFTVLAEKPSHEGGTCLPFKVQQPSGQHLATCPPA